MTDLGLPGVINGRQLADAGRELRHALKTLFITGYTATIVDRTLGPGIQILTKPFSIDALAAQVRGLMHS
ncbi:histidine kinase [Caballeronia grimmiae]|uniref:Histidine kinase n=1 Tax=Caballeronia grimmiae TaxID=1071679 RepID=A0A069NFP5_9BURK|nr:histidine kinase [Caballeronia grimmiae]